MGRSKERRVAPDVGDRMVYTDDDDGIRTRWTVATFDGVMVQLHRDEDYAGASVTARVPLRVLRESPEWDFADGGYNATDDAFEGVPAPPGTEDSGGFDTHDLPPEPHPEQMQHNTPEFEEGGDKLCGLSADFKKRFNRDGTETHGAVFVDADGQVVWRERDDGTSEDESP